ncbi:MAG: hypothetical protein CMG71_08295 [Candidatus Marinimicrobia bacterium]|nr:hypothetical protein [Candidatus Neomarinimicrobiota bacterium]|tara:strand:+ start:217 stop:2844 length:2628 start_codon:yes stop_codon:yes gene_type:complete
MTVSSTLRISLFDFHQLEQVLVAWPQNADALNDFTEFSDGIYKRIHQIFLAAYNRGGLPSYPDFLPLIRQVALKRLCNGNSAKLRVKLGNGWPDREVWQSFGFTCQDTVDHRVVTPMEWRPNWLPIPEDCQSDIFADCFEEIPVRVDGEIPIDPFIGELTGYNAYMCPGQKEAVLSALFMPEGSTLIVNLPTGAGKTLVAQAPILMNGLNKGLSIFVVPTTALAIDQARRMKELLERKKASSNIPPLAWHGELAKHEKETIKSNIRQGRQGIIFASPEAATGALLPSIYSAAKSGLLRYLIVDEAHLIAAWGDSFRPAFQTIAGLRRGLLECSTQGSLFRTILMSATFSPESVNTLEKLFGPPDKVQMVSAVHLRPEPRYWVAAATDEEEKRKWVIELLKHAPRPFILYVTKREDASKWSLILERELGNERVTTFTGKTANLKREQIIQDWAGNKLDGIIATSAFGVGIDKSDVRTVIHATVPESLDRFYQEVGRGGRDGNASLSVTVYSPSDIQIADNMSAGKHFTKENAFSRWTAMFNRSRREDGRDNFRYLDVRTTPPKLQQQTDFNESWNMRTLILMARAGLIEIASDPPTTLERLAQEDDAAFQQRVEGDGDEYYATIPIRTLDGGHLNQAHFNDCVGAEQSRNNEAAKKSLRLLLNALRGEKEMGKTIAHLYTSRKPGRQIIVSQVCRGCPAHGKTVPRDELVYQIPIGVGIGQIAQQSPENWSQDFPENSDALVIYYPEGTDQLSASLKRVLESLVANYGILEVVAPRELWDSKTGLSELHKRAARKLLVRRDLEPNQDSSGMLPLPTVSVLLPWGRKPIPTHIEHLERPINVILVPENISSYYQHKRLVDIAQNCISINDFIRTAER